MKKPLVILGFMGSGKSTLGHQLAKEWKQNFIDLDLYISEMFKMSIAQLFEHFGESGFRERESVALKQVLDQTDKCIISLGGGTPCFNQNLSLIKEKTQSVYLRLSPEELTKRLMRSTNPRPLVEGKSAKELLAYIKVELNKREFFYSQADHIIQSDSIRLQDLLAFIRLK